MDIQINNSSKSLKLMAKCSFLLFLLLCILQCTARKDLTRIARNVIGQSNFIFSGTIVKMNASNIDVITNDPTAIVQVDEVLYSVPPYDQMKAEEITVLLASDQNRIAGGKEVFYTMGWYYGKTLGVKEIANKLREEDLSFHQERITRERINIQNDSLVVELKKAILIVQGIVVETDIFDEKYPPFESEHDPAFRKAIIDIKEVLKGDMPEMRVGVYFSSSIDVMWSNSPKPKKGQEGIFLIHLNQAPAIFKMQDLTILDKRDIQSTENLIVIQGLLNQ